MPPPQPSPSGGEGVSADVYLEQSNIIQDYSSAKTLPPHLRGRVGVGGILDFLQSRVGKLDGVVITGGEPTLHKDLPEFIKEIKNLGFTVKLDTNGTNSDMLKDLIDGKLIDYVAMDIKSPIEKYSKIVCHPVNTENILKSIEIIINSGIEHEFRTTVVKSQLTYADFEKIGALIKSADKYYLQKFVPTKTLNKEFLTESTYSEEEFSEIVQFLTQSISCVELR